jgi:sigma-B regulation protein RsbU (phosphoserine phosphatase)
MSSSLSDQNLEMFKGFPSEQVEQIVSMSEFKKLAPGETLIHPGQPNDTLFLVLEGMLQIVLEKDGATFSIPIQPGESLGEMSILMERSTSAQVDAVEDSQVLCIPENTFWDHIMTTRQGARNLMSLMAARLQRTNQSLIRNAEEQLKYQHLQKELEIAGTIQANLVPDGQKLLPNRQEVDAYALINQARDVGGDFYDALVLDDEHVYLAIGDVSGKGMPASLFMVRAFTFLRMVISNNPSFEGVIPSLNQWLARKNKDMMFITLFAGVLNLKTGKLRYVNAGHNPPFASIGGKPYQLMEDPTSPLVGVLDEADFPIQELQLQAGDSLVLYTDGIPEATNAQRVMLDTGPVLKVLNQETYTNMEALVRALEAAGEDFVGSAPQHDDFTAFAVRLM